MSSLRCAPPKAEKQKKGPSPKKGIPRSAEDMAKIRAGLQRGRMRRGQYLNKDFIPVFVDPDWDEGL